MELIQFNAARCDLCGACIRNCPFDALSMGETGIEVNENCKVCNLCVRACHAEAIYFEQKAGTVDKSLWRDILVYGEVEGDRLHPVTFELLGEARRLAEKVGYRVHCVVVGPPGAEKLAGELVEYGASRVYVYAHPGFTGFKADCYTDAVADCIATLSPSVVLIGATPSGRSMAPRLSTRFHTGLTADCTALVMEENTDLVQIRPAFGGNVMAEILIPDSRPQFATVRYKVMSAARRVPHPDGEVVLQPVTDAMVRSRITVGDIRPIQRSRAIEDEEVLVVAGRGVRDENGLELVGALADRLGGQLCYTRPMVEAGHGDTAHQIGLSGRTVSPKLVITCGVSGAIQFTSCIRGAECIVAIDADPEAQIFQAANYCIQDDLYQVIPRLLRRLEREESR